MTEVQTGLVSGREYTSTRVRGLAPWNPRQDTLRLVQRVQDILGRYSAQLPLTNRQIFYILVGSEEGYPKNENAYARLCEMLNRARRAGYIPFEAIRDDGTQSDGFPGWSGPSGFWGYVRRLARGYRHNLRDGQPYHVELWVEAGGMVPQAAAVAGDYGIIVYSAGGFNGLTDKYETARRLSRYERSIVLHCGDYDPSGLSIVDALAEDVTALVHGLDPSVTVEFRRVLVTPNQIADYGLPSAPQKGSDNRGEWMEETVQAEALDPVDLASEIRAACDDVTDEESLEAAREQGDGERDSIITTLDDLIE
jgi:hypothetical protein